MTLPKMNPVPMRLFIGALLLSIMYLYYQKSTRTETSENLKRSTITSNTKNVSNTTSENSLFDNALAKQFGEVYKRGLWGLLNGEAYSGEGSTSDYTKEYRPFLESFFVTHNITSVLDAPCGLWTFSQLINWGPVQNYTGIDIVPEILKKNEERYGNLTLRPKFMHMSMLNPDLPAADLLITKDAMQHLPLKVCKEFLQIVFSKKADGTCKYKHLLITNDLLSSQNPDHPLSSDGKVYTSTRDLRLAPFLLQAENVFSFGTKVTPQVGKTTQHYNMERLGCDHDFS